MPNWLLNVTLKSLFLPQQKSHLSLAIHMPLVPGNLMNARAPAFPNAQHATSSDTWSRDKSRRAWLQFIKLKEKSVKAKRSLGCNSYSLGMHSVFPCRGKEEIGEERCKNPQIYEVRFSAQRAQWSYVNIAKVCHGATESQPVSTMVPCFSSFLRCLRWFFFSWGFYFGQYFACKGPGQLIISEGIPLNLYLCFKPPSWVLDHYSSCVS